MKAPKSTPNRASSKWNAVQRGPETIIAREARTHVVRRGDTLGHIAAAYRVSRHSLAAANGLANPGALRVGQRLVIPPASERSGARIPSTDGELGPARPPEGTPMLASVGPRRVPTRLLLAVPELDGPAIDFVWPVDGPVLSSIERRARGWHAGIDIKAEIGTPIVAAAPGIVSFSGWERAYGHVVKIQHTDGFATVYAHNLRNMVRTGDRVDTATVIGTVGRSGRTTGVHLHFEIRHHGVVYNPLYLLPARDLIARLWEEPSEASAPADGND